MNNYRAFLNEAFGYYNLLMGDTQKVYNKLGGKVVFSIGSMAVEKFMVAVLVAKEKAVNGHSIGYLLTLCKECFETIPEKILGLSSLDQRLDLCSFEAVNSPDFTFEDFQLLQVQLKELKSFVDYEVEKVNSLELK
ncbi:MAG: hypothetical protein JXA77_08710 [Bacteroidales bacterium]|nr:hypothetical protein [Bacteroidales bacterium]MBN2817587.1 hypothetical protein [Bacteroidales bacterium]